MAHISSAMIDVAYFSMEIMLESDIPTYSGGLGVLAGDILRSCADTKTPALGVSLVYSGGVIKQHIEHDGTQSFLDVPWSKNDQLTKLTDRITLSIHGEDVSVGVWRYDIVGLSGYVVPVFLLDTDLPGNSLFARSITQHLYEDKADIRLSQEIILGVGGVYMLKKLGYSHINTYHMNEGHCAFVPLALLEDHAYNDDEVRARCTFTSHTPIPEGHDIFDYEFAYQYAEKYLPWHIRDIAGQDKLHMTHLASTMSKKSFAVSEKHEKVMGHIFPNLEFHHITNGVHHRSWIHPSFQDVYETYIPGSLEDPSKLRNNISKVPDDVLWYTHQQCKAELIHYIQNHSQHTGDDVFDSETLTIALGRRPVPYKRPLLLYHDIERLVSLGSGKLQIVQCGKSHPNDHSSQETIQNLFSIARSLRGIVRITYIENYSPHIARMLVSGADVWLNTPMQPLEASGTSGMKASLNGLVNLSIPDGWWLEAMRMDPQSGYTIGKEIAGLEAQFDNDADAQSLYNCLENDILPAYYNQRSAWITTMKKSIALGGYFNTHRCVKEYAKNAWSRNP